MDLKLYKPYLNWLENQADNMKQCLIEWSNINSGSHHLEGLVRMRKALSEAFLEVGGEQKVVDVAPKEMVSLSGKMETVVLGDILQIRQRPKAPHQILLVGHMDTVFDQTHPFQQVRELPDNRLNGPGVADMKGGLVVMLFALLALERTPIASQLGWEVIINSDEELGSPGSASFLEQRAQYHQLGLVFEPPLDIQGTLASSRKGSGKFTVAMHGRAAHAGRAFQQGRNAICALAELILQLDTLNGQQEGVTLNIGKIQGGSALNVVPDQAVCQFDVRTSSTNDEQWLKQHMERLIQHFNQREDYRVELSGSFTRQPKLFTPQTEKLFMNVKQLSEQIGTPLQWQPTGDCSDGNNLAAKGLPVIDSLGVRGGAIHTAEEFMIVDSLLERARLTALVLMGVANGDFHSSLANCPTDLK